MSYKYSTQLIENSAKAIGLALPISRKQSIMICQKIRGMNVQKAKNLLEKVMNKKEPIPFTRFAEGAGHKAGMSSGKYPIKACSQILTLLKSAEANAQYKGLGTGNLIVKHVVTQKGPTTQKHGRIRGNAKRTHVEIVLEESKTTTEKKTKQKKVTK